MEEYKTKEELQKQVDELMEKGEFSEELLEKMEQLDNWGKQEEEPLKEVKEVNLLEMGDIIKQFEVKLRPKTKTDWVDVERVYKVCNQNKLTEDERNKVIQQIVKNTRKKTNCYAWVKRLQGKSVDKTISVWEKISDARIMFSYEPKIVEVGNIKNIDEYLEYWSELDLKFQVQ